MHGGIVFCYLTLHHLLISSSTFNLPGILNQRYSKSHIYAEMIINVIRLYNQFHIPFLHIVGKIHPLDNSGISTLVTYLQL